MTLRSFDDIEVIQEEVAPQVIDKYYHQKQKLLFNVTRSKEVCDALSAWLMSFEGGMSKEVFTSQVARLSMEDEVALAQIRNSLRKRSIAKVRTALPKLPEIGNVLDLLAQNVLFIAVSGKELALHNFIRNTYRTLKSLGSTYVLDLNDLKLEWLDKFQKGKSTEMLRRAKEAEFLMMVGFETPLDLPFYIGDTLNTLRRYRVEHEYPIISTFARFREKEKFFEYFQKFSVK